MGRAVRMAAAALLVIALGAIVLSVDLTVSSPSPARQTPSRIALQLFSIDLVAVGLFGWRRKRKNAAVGAT